MYQPRLNPQPFGPVNVSTPGTPVALTTKLVALGLALVGDPVPVNKVSVIAFPNNSGTVYLGLSTMSKATMQGVLAALLPGGSWQINNEVAVNTYRADMLYVDADVAGDGVYGGLDQV